MGFRLSFALVPIILGLSSLAYSSSVGIPIDGEGAPAVDLRYRGQDLDQGVAIDLKRRGIDLSTLDPKPNDIWSPTNHFEAIQDPRQLHFPTGNPIVNYHSDMGSSQGIFRTRVTSKGTNFQLMMGLGAHASLARNALLRLLGYPIPTPNYYSTLTVRFNDLTQRSIFLDSLSDGTLTARTRWIRELPEDTPEVTLQDVILEHLTEDPQEIEQPLYHWGVIPASHLKSRRASRALIIPIVLLEIPESLNIFSYEFGQIFNNTVLLTSPYADSFTEDTFDDARWIARKILALNQEQLKEVILAGRYPAKAPEISALLFEKLKARRNQLITLFKLYDYKTMPVNTALSYGSVVDGKLTTGTYDGYASRFTYGDPDAPLRMSEVASYLQIEGISTAMRSLTSQINTYLQVQSVKDLQDQHQKQLFKDFIKYAIANPGKPPQTQGLNVWGGPFGGFSIDVSRDVTTGTYYGIPGVQLVDSVQVSASIGAFGQLDGLPPLVPKGPALFPTATASLSVQRNYLHVRPVEDLKTAAKVNKVDIFVPHFINRLTEILNDPGLPGSTTASTEGDPTTTSETASGSAPETIDDIRFKKLLDTLKENEMIVIVDTVAASVQGKVRVPIPVLLDPAMAQFNPSIGVGASVSPSVLKRTTILRTTDGIQVYLENAKVLDEDIQFDFNWWMNIARVSHGKKNALGRSKGYVLDKEVDTSEERRKLVSSLKGLFRGSSEILEDSFKDYEIKHDLKLKNYNRGSVLWWRPSSFEEQHTVTVSPPNYPNNSRKLYSDRYVYASGKDFYSFLGNIIAAIPGGYASLPPTYGLPSNSFLGSAHWSSVMIQAELTPGRKSDPVCMLERHWAGWILDMHRFNKILDSLEAKVKPLSLEKPIVDRDDFATTQGLEMYDIQSSVIIYEKGMKRILATLFKDSKREVVEELIRIEGEKDLDAWCLSTWNSLKSRVKVSYSFKENGNPVNYVCLKPWMVKALHIRDEVLKENAKLQRKDKTITDEKEINWHARLMRKLEHYMELHKLLAWVGKENYFLQVKVSAYQKNNENGDVPVVSNTLGTFSTKAGAGPFRDFSLKTGIFPFELNAGYLSTGY